MGVLFSSCSRRKAFPLNKVYKGGRRQEIKFGFGLKPCRLTTQIYFMMCTADHRVGVCVVECWHDPMVHRSQCYTQHWAGPFSYDLPLPGTERFTRKFSQIPGKLSKMK
jgi:hypothetical protein